MPFKTIIFWLLAERSDFLHPAPLEPLYAGIKMLNSNSKEMFSASSISIRTGSSGQGIEVGRSGALHDFDWTEKSLESGQARQGNLGEAL